MLLSGLGNIDFAGLASLGDLSRADLFSRLRNALQPGSIFSVSDDQISSILTAVLGRYKLIGTPDALDQNAADAVDADVQSIVVGVLGTSVALAYKNEITGVVNNLKANYSLVPLSFQARAASSPAPASSSYSNAAPSRQSLINVQSQPAPGGAQQDIRFVTRQQRMTPKQKSRLLWFLGIGAVVFAISMGLLAGSGD